MEYTDECSARGFSFSSGNSIYRKGCSGLRLRFWRKNDPVRNWVRKSVTGIEVLQEMLDEANDSRL